MKDMLISFVEVVLGAKDEAEFEAMQERVMNGEFKEEWNAYIKGMFNDA